MVDVASLSLEFTDERPQCTMKTQPPCLRRPVGNRAMDNTYHDVMEDVAYENMVVTVKYG